MSEQSQQPQVYTPSRATVIHEIPPAIGDASEIESRLSQLDNYGDDDEAEAIDDVISASTQAPSVESETPQQNESKFAPEDIQRFSEMFQEMFGLAPEDMKQQLGSFQAQQKQAQLQQDFVTLQEEWGVDGEEVGRRLQLVEERLGKMSSSQRAALDNLEGIRLIYDAIGNASSPPTPKFDKSTRKSGSRNKPMFTQAEIDALSPRDYERNAERILFAYRNNLVSK